ncbi:peroxide stress protein YaaA [Rickettsiales endosymbiont of Stachyamoeba lipophora]|uniref:peroxide stress protein YaaA n=1 Tax=Rickettsiales endosymbiont of Stachyamoeba lipophora TaxID=2486578 RepID=UPI000F653AA9|nr:peroxide stress protein YaaA [Rickettsiales endosymbiont of Stachyamoeba lipophora]AZL15514.1 peroxide stress protein YaaA [Rickettsiales endosymbiont of Stachyamoeba lipophora]
MLALLSPAKTLDYESGCNLNLQPTLPQFLERTLLLIRKLKTQKLENLIELMGISHKLAELNYQRYQQFSEDYHSNQLLRPALLCFKGDVYLDLEVDNYSLQDFEFANRHIAILSGLFGILKPLDLLYPYRLEMGTNTKELIGQSLYQYWQQPITDYVNNNAGDLLINLASQEYFEVINSKELKVKLININFKENKDGAYKIIGIHAKRARGAFANWLIRNRITKQKDLESFHEKGYKFNEQQSDNNNLIFTRG